VSPRRPYGFERRRKEDARRAKQEAKRQRRSERPAGARGPEVGEPPETGPPPGQWEWFSPSRSRTLGLPAGQRPPDDPPADWVLLTDAEEGSEAGEEPDEGSEGGERSE
jgi:hypothetical protein